MKAAGYVAAGVIFRDDLVREDIAAILARAVGRGLARDADLVRPLTGFLP